MITLIKNTLLNTFFPAFFAAGIMTVTVFKVMFLVTTVFTLMLHCYEYGKGGWGEPPGQITFWGRMCCCRT